MLSFNRSAARCAGAVLVLTCFVGVSRPAGAQVSTVSLDELVSASSSVIVGRTVSHESSWTEDGRRILTHVRVTVDETVLGEAAQEVELVIPGGRVGNTVQEVSDMPAFIDGEEVLVFVWTSPDGRKMVVGGALGKLGVVRATDGQRSVQGLGHLVRDAAPTGSVRGDTRSDSPGRSLNALPLEEVLDRIRSVGK